MKPDTFLQDEVKGETEVNNFFGAIQQLDQKKFLDEVKREYQLANDKEFQAQKKKRQQEEYLRKRKMEYIEEFKNSIMASAKEGHKECWFRINRDITAEELTNIIGLKIRFENRSGSYGNHGYNSYDEDYYVATIAE
jgi:hypothetical protein